MCWRVLGVGGLCVCVCTCVCVCMFSGNDFMKSEKFSDALESYSQAIRLDGKNAVYYCNRCVLL